MEQAASTANAHCNVCNGTRTHIVLYREDTSWSEENGRYQGADTYETLKCAGCDAIKLRHHATYPSEPFESTTYFPAATFRRHPKWFHDLKFELLLDNDSVVDLLNEIYVALQHGLLRIAAMGVRALLERMMITPSSTPPPTFRPR